MTRRCSHCGHNGHNSRTCPNRGVKLFGVRLTDGSIRKSASMGNLAHYAGSGSGSGSPADGPPADHGTADGYASEDFIQGSRERKKVISGCPILVGVLYAAYASRVRMEFHGPNMSIECFYLDCKSLAKPANGQLHPMVSDEPEAQSNNPLPAPPAQDEELESMDSNSNDGEGPVPKPESYGAADAVEKRHEIVKPTAMHSKVPINVDELVGMSKLSLGESSGETGSSSLSLKLVGSSELYRLSCG
ncbi:transcription factor MYBS3 [Cocos nucifera]|uniref:Transcription factor MYBS3 n=1 Tax=Cocos nucifera TaxID=13894 RepID=A0A8K0IHW9_COCNU|nr:transcription factor MYBS3 [Cocos nucifera]